MSNERIRDRTDPSDLEPEMFQFIPGREHRLHCYPGYSREFIETAPNEEDLQEAFRYAKLTSIGVDPNLPSQKELPEGKEEVSVIFFSFEEKHLPLAVYYGGVLEAYCRPEWREGADKPDFYPM